MKILRAAGGLLAAIALSAISDAPAFAQPEPQLEAYFTERSYDPGQSAQLRVRNASSRLTIQIMRAGGERGSTPGHSTLRGVPVGPPAVVRTADGEWASVAVQLEQWQSGLFYARVTSGRRTAFAPFVLRASPIMRSRVAVVLPTNTWQAYNFRDDDGDGIPNTWYADPTVTTVELSRPFESRGVPPHFRQYDLGFIRWLTLTGKSPDYFADDDLERVDGRSLARKYDLVVFPGHEEYVTEHAYNAIERYYGLGGNLMFLTSNNFFRRVVRVGHTITRTEKWRELGRPEARWIGAQYVDWNEYRYPNQRYLVVGAHRARWLFRGTELMNGSRFGRFGIEIDMRTADSPPGTQVVATIPEIFGPGKSAEMVFHTTPAGAHVFAAGAMTLGGSAMVEPMRQMVANLWERLSRP